MALESQDDWRRRRRKTTTTSSASSALSSNCCTIVSSTDNNRRNSNSRIHRCTTPQSLASSDRMTGHRAAVLLSCCVLLAGGLASAFNQPLALRNPMLRIDYFDSNNNGNNNDLQSTVAIDKKSYISQTVSTSRLYSSTLYSSTSSREQSTQKTDKKKSQSQKPSNRSNNGKKKAYKKKGKYTRKLPLSPSEKAALRSRKKRRAAYEKMRTTSMEKTNEPPSIWSFDSLFAAPVFDKKTIRDDLYGSKEREGEMRERQLIKEEMNKIKDQKRQEVVKKEKGYLVEPDGDGQQPVVPSKATTREEDLELTRQTLMSPVEGGGEDNKDPVTTDEKTIDKTLTRMVEDRIYGMTRSPEGSIQYSTSLLDSTRAVQFREGVRLGKALSINIDRLCHFAKKDFSRGRLEEAQEHYMEALNLDPTDGRPYLGLSRIAQRRGDLDQARGLLKKGIGRSSGGFVRVKGPGTVAVVEGKRKGSKRNNGKSDDKSVVDFEEEEGSTLGTIHDLGPNPFLLQALGTLEQKRGNLSAAEELYLQAIRSRPSHAAAWVSLAQLRTKELRQGAAAGRVCYQSAERELARIGAKPSSYVYTAWASLEYKKRKEDMKSAQKARELYQKALAVDPNCSVAYLQFGVMESECDNFDKARECFETVLTFDQRNSRVLQAYAIMESRRPLEEVDSRKVIDLFERALKANPRDAGVYQAYALYVVELGDIDSARDLLRSGTEVNKRHAPAWQAWGVLETRYSTAKIARDVFQQGIWACAHPGGGQSGGRRCARLWQAWGMLESYEGDHAAARRCFGRALDADQRNVAAVTAWTSMEAEMGNYADARSIFERSLKQFRSPSSDKTSIWRAYEIMEERAGHTRQAQTIFQRSMIDSTMEEQIRDDGITTSDALAPTPAASKPKPSKRSKEVEFSRWNTESNEMDAEVWMNNGSIEGKVPASMMNKLKSRSNQ